MLIKGIQIPFRTDEYGNAFYGQNGANDITVFALRDGVYEDDAVTLCCKPLLQNDILLLDIFVHAKTALPYERFGFRLGVDSYMDTFPEWNDKFFPTALRCEANGFWGCFCSPNGNMLAVASPCAIVSYKYEYNDNGVAGHRIYTASVEFMNSNALPERHQIRSAFTIGQTYHYQIYLTAVSGKAELYEFVKKYAGIQVVDLQNYTVQKNDAVFSADGKPLSGYDTSQYGRYVVSNPGCAELRYFVRRPWRYYLQCADKSAHICQQKAGTHAESWYGFFSRIAACKMEKSAGVTAQLVKDFDSFFHLMTWGFLKKRLHKNALPHRLQNISCLMSVLCDMFELTQDKKYLRWANDLANWLMTLQAPDGSFRSHGVHYTCVIYPAKSMLELALTEKDVGLTARYRKHYASALAAVQDLALRLDDIETEGEMTFEDGMISCSALQLGYMALHLAPEDSACRKKFTKAAALLLQKHFCIEQKIVPDSRSYGATLRFWEARYDLNFFANMMNTPHGWTSWKNYATYYLYLLTGEEEYLIDTMNTLGACMQCVQDDGTLCWGFITDPCVTGKRLCQTKSASCGVSLQTQSIGESYLPMMSSWYRQPKRKRVFQYIINPNFIGKHQKDFGGSCDNDVHEHFKCLSETVFGKAFAHEKKDGTWLLFDCKKSGDAITASDFDVAQLIVYTQQPCSLYAFGEMHNVPVGFSFLSNPSLIDNIKM